MKEAAYQNGVHLLTRLLRWDSKKAGGLRTSFYSVKKTKFQLQHIGAWPVSSDAYAYAAQG